jgi:two-component system nitrate/nitrite response regulator NarL
MKKASARKIRLLLVDDHPIVLEGIRSHLAAQPEFEIVGDASNGHEALTKARLLEPDIILLDISMPGMNGLETMVRLRKTVPHIKVLILTMHCSKEYVSQIIAAGVRGYLLKDAAPAELVQAIKLVHEGQVFYSPRVSRVVLDDLVRGRPNTVAPDPLVALTERERQVLIGIAEGLSNKEIASHLNLGVRTVETHRERIMRKLDIHSIAGLTRFAISKGLVGLM